MRRPASAPAASDGTATLTFAAGDGTVTLSQDDGRRADLRGRRRRGRGLRHGHARRTSRRSTPSAARRPTRSCVDLTAGLFARPDESLTALDAALAGGADTLDVRLPDEDNVVLGGTLGADLDGDAAPDVTWAATERLRVTGLVGRRRPRVRRRRRGPRRPARHPGDASTAATATTRCAAARRPTRSRAAPARTSSPTTTAPQPSARASTALADDGAAGEGDRIGTDVEDRHRRLGQRHADGRSARQRARRRARATTSSAAAAAATR